MKAAARAADNADITLEGPMDREIPDLDRLLDDPFVRVSPTGETLQLNRAFQEIADACGVPPELIRLFGPDAIALVETVAREGRARGFLPLKRGPEPRRTFRLSLKGVEGGPISVHLLDVTDEVVWRRRLSERNRDLTVLNEIGAAVSGTLDLDALARRIHEQAGRIMRTTSFYIALHDRATEQISFPIYVENHAPRIVGPRCFANGLTEHVLRSRRPVLLLGDVLGQARALGIEPVGRPSSAYLAAPMIADGEALGVVALQDFERPDAYDEHDLEVLTIIAGQAAAAVRTARLFAESRAAYQELSQTQGRLLEAERLRGITETVGALNHEVNNPLAAIAGNAQLLLRCESGVCPDARHKIETILEAARRIQRVTARMASLIQASSTPYPGQSVILDVRRSVSRDEIAGAPPGEPEASPPPGTASDHDSQKPAA
jgi:GAF domain-containing protein